jgi:hypothetical protein
MSENESSFNTRYLKMPPGMPIYPGFPGSNEVKPQGVPNGTANGSSKTPGQLLSPSEEYKYNEIPPVTTASLLQSPASIVQAQLQAPTTPSGGYVSVLQSNFVRAPIQMGAGSRVVFGVETPPDPGVFRAMRRVSDIDSATQQVICLQEYKVSQIRVQWSNKKDAELITGIKFYYNHLGSGSPLEGGPILGSELPNSQAFISLKEREFLISVQGNISNHIHCVCFKSNFGRQWIFGKQEKSFSSIVAQPGCHLLFSDAGVCKAVNFLAFAVKPVPATQAPLVIMSVPSQIELLQELKVQVMEQSRHLQPIVPQNQGSIIEPFKNMLSSIFGGNPAPNPMPNQYVGNPGPQNQVFSTQFQAPPNQIMGSGYVQPQSTLGSNLGGVPTTPQVFMTQKVGVCTGTPFDDYFEMMKKDKNAQPRIFGIRVWHDKDQLIHGIEVDYVDQRTAGIFHRGDHKGLAARNGFLLYKSLVLEPDDWISEVKGFYEESCLLRLEIGTEQGRSLAVGVCAGEEAKNVIPRGACLIGAAGATKTHLQGLYFVYTL